ncbi:ATP-binding protein [Aquincola tertiaricarbonis]|uniref:ATP-binding protein n=1 Tax=Aquincola tertiaricarbonis TaxID=391953 RepID=A0ABY4SAD8_AQUTE|nr:ATP-binding protein [Aquincola tertiaricarbonis]URI09429.1 ATP-binding protein [Aquincola tertiaricarbonis]
MCCLIGPGDSGKSSALDAIEAALSSRWIAFTETDFFCCDTSQQILIEATVGELSKQLLSDERFGLHLRGWTRQGDLRDEPEGNDEGVLTVRLSVDATLEPVWELVNERASSQRILSNRDRALFGLVRLSGEDARHLTWGQGSVLSRLTGDIDQAANNLAEAYRAAKASANLSAVPELAGAALVAQKQATALGAYAKGAYHPGLELGRGGFSTASIALHDAGVPLRLAGLGTRRLATLAIQRGAIKEGALVLIDEIEHGLEPHRVMGAIAQLKRAQQASVAAGSPVGQVVMSTHSDVALTEAEAASIFIARRDRGSGATTIGALAREADFGKLLKKTPRALFARKILLCEGATEVGILLGMKDLPPWLEARAPLEHLGVAIADGDGTQAPALACALARLGYAVAIFRDSDRRMTEEQRANCLGAAVPVIEYPNQLNTETAALLPASDAQVDRFIRFAKERKGQDSVNAALAHRFGEKDFAFDRPFADWDADLVLTKDEQKAAIADAAVRKDWIKELQVGREIAPLLLDIAVHSPASPLSTTLAAVRGWLYA